MAKRLSILCMAMLVAALAIGTSVFLTSAGATGQLAPKTYYFTWYDSKPANGMNGDQIVVGNLEDFDASVQVYFGTESTPRESFTLPAKGRQLISWPDTMGGPVRVVSQNGAALVVTQRVFFLDSFNEVAAIEGSNLDSSYYFTWYDSMPVSGMNGNWILVSNVDTVQASVDVYIGATKMGTYTLDPGQQVEPSYSNLMNGPVRVIGNGAKIIASQRVLYHQSFNEVMGVPAGSLDSMYMFTWYDLASNGMNGNWVLMSNLNPTTVHAQVYIGNDPNPRGTYALPPNQSVTPTYPGLIDGPVRVVCTDCGEGQKIMVSQRVLYKQSFEEVQGTPPSGFDDQMYFGWYDFSPGVAGDWLLIANQGLGDAAVDVYIGSSLEPKGSFTLGEGGRTTPDFWGVTDGPVRIVNNDGKPLLASQRILYKNSFNELIGLTKQETGQPLPLPPQLKLYRLNTYWANMADYNLGRLSVQMRIADMGQGTAYGTTITSVTASNGVTTATGIPIALGDIAGNGGYKNFVVQYNVPEGVSSFMTAVNAQCQDNYGDYYYYP